MKRLVLALLAVGMFAPATAAHAAVPCRDRIYNDWYADGKIATTYPLACYRDAIKHVPLDAREYSSLADDIRAAMLGARERLDGRSKVPAAIGRGQLRATQNADNTSSSSSSPHDPASDGTRPVDPPQAPTTTSSTATVAVGSTTGDGGGVPVPLLVLGSVAILLAAAGVVGAVAKRRRA